MNDAPDHIEYLTDWSSCPVCGDTLKLRPTPDFGETYWHCVSCLTQWDTFDLIDAINTELALQWQRGEDGEVVD